MPGRPGRWKIGLPRCNPGGGVVGALYTGRGPVCGMMTRRTGGAGVAGVAAAGCGTVGDSSVTEASGAAATGGGSGAGGACA
jgi:hypothetical protein